MPNEPKDVPLTHPLRAIDVEGIPEPLAIALNSMVHTLRRQLAASEPQRRSRNRLLTKPGTVRGDISRAEIYGDIA